MNTYAIEYYEVKSFFREGGKVVGTQRCANLLNAMIFAKHQRKMFDYVEVLLVNGLIYPNGIIEVKRAERIEVFK